MSYESQMQELDAQMMRLKQRKKAVAARWSERSRKARTHALCVMGGMLERCIGSWEEADMQRLSELISKNAAYFAKAKTNGLPLEEASARIKQWERDNRAQKLKGDTYETT